MEKHNFSMNAAVFNDYLSNSHKSCKYLDYPAAILRNVTKIKHSEDKIWSQVQYVKITWMFR